MLLFGVDTLCLMCLLSVCLAFVYNVHSAFRLSSAGELLDWQEKGLRVDLS